MNSRSKAPITLADLLRLGTIASQDRNSLFHRKPELARLYSDRVFAAALCQGAALHYLDGKNGVKDFDVWSFYRAHSDRPFPYRRRGVADFGDPKFGKTEGFNHFQGRRVDLLGRSVNAKDFSDPVSVLRGYLAAGKTKSARCLAQKAVILIEPSALLGTVVWPA